MKSCFNSNLDVNEGYSLVSFFNGKALLQNTSG